MAKEPETITISRDTFVDVMQTAYASLFFSMKLTGVLIERGALSPTDIRVMLAQLMKEAAGHPSDSAASLSTKSLQFILDNLNRTFPLS